MLRSLLRRPADPESDPRPPAAPRAGRWARFGALPPVMKLLISTQLAFNVGFYMVLPYLATHLAEDLGLAAAAVGLVLGLRTFSQQGLFVVGGALTDRFGAKPVVLAGCVLRVIGFILLGAAGTLPAVIGGALLTGFAAALFSPAVESSLAREAGERERAGEGPPRTAVFGMFAVAGQVGTVTGPLVGTALLLVDFRTACLVAAFGFVLVGLAHWRWLPWRTAERAGSPILAGWGEVLGNRRFMAFAAGYSGWLLTYNQLYLALPAELERIDRTAALGFLFVMMSVLVITLQLRVTGWSRRFGAGRSVVLGFCLMAASFLVVAIARLLPDLPGWWALAPAVTMVLLLTFGEMFAVPVAQDLVPRLAGERRLGAHFGVLASFGGLLVLIGSTTVGALLDPAFPPALPFLVLAAVPLLGALVLGMLARRGALAS
ncbi:MULTISPECIES: MDR family MFS transporter [Pseudonocardia]|uniref:Multidrug resistance protein MdtH n=1 Tax=Pseudonocardia autotrophica TaxID=2074 RepID=A0A1Y2MSP1_PSEAH|nr:MULTISPECIES: MFS transporter [Pseudonocardia]OSY37989.1 Multidrug resistance protein MdtH [Pseudonocardia autotrophica]TDN74650.1 nitrate/nitrite transporter NarK [Pseudonocardia autotrophica]